MGILSGGGRITKENGGAKMAEGSLVVNVDLRIESKYKRALSGEQKAELAERMLELIELPEAPKLELSTGESAGPKELVSHSMSMGEKTMSYSVRPKGWVFESLAAKEIEHVGGALAFARMRSGPLASAGLAAAQALGMIGPERLERMGKKAARERGLELARAYMQAMSAFFKQRFRPYNPHEEMEAAEAARAGGERGGAEQEGFGESEQEAGQEARGQSKGPGAKR